MKAKRDYLVATPITMSVHRRGEDPHGTGCFHITVGNHDGVTDVAITNYDTELRMTSEELTAVYGAAQRLIAQFNDNGEVRK